jgi:hypothetical protein
VDEKKENGDEGADWKVDEEAWYCIVSTGSRTVRKAKTLHHLQLAYSVKAPPTRGPKIIPS